MKWSGARSSLIVFGLGACVSAQTPGTFNLTGDMTTARVYHTATLLADGRVLIAGGVQGRVSNAELYEPSTGTFAAIGPMTTGRVGHTATRLANGTVLLAGGNNGFVSSAEIYDPSTQTFTATGNMTTPINNQGHTATLLADGKVLILARWGPVASPANSAEIYDPATGVFSSLPNLNSYFDATETVLLADGTVLAGNQIYQPSTGTFTFTKTSLDSNEFAPPGDEGSYTASLLLDGTVLTAGGGYLDFSDVCLFNGNLYKPDLGVYTAVGDMKVCRLSHTGTLLPTGAVLVAGGWSPGNGGINGPVGILAESELYDPSTGTFAPSGNMTSARTDHTATLLKDGRVLITGGMGIEILATAEIYTPPILSPAPVLLSLSGDGTGQGAVQHADTYQLVSANNPAIAGEALVVYFTGLVDGSLIPPQVSIDGRMAEVLWFGDTPGYAGLNQVNIRVPSGIAPGPAVTVRLTYLDRPSNEVTIGVQ